MKPSVGRGRLRGLCFFIGRLSAVQVILATIGFWVTQTICAQQFIEINEPAISKPYVIYVVEDEEATLLETRVYLASNNDVAHLIVPASNFTTDAVADNINTKLNTDKRTPFQFLHLVIVGDNTHFEKFADLSEALFATQTYMTTSDVPEADRSLFKIIRWFSADLKDFLLSIDKTYTMRYKVDHFKESRRETIYKLKRNMGITLSTGISVPVPRGLSDDFPSATFPFSLSIDKRFTNKFDLIFSLHGGFKIPKPQKIIQGEIQSQLDPSALLNGEDLEIDLNTTIRGRIYVGASFEARRFLGNSKSRPFVQAGLMVSSLNLIAFEIDTTLTIDSDDLSLGVGGSGLGGGGFGGEGNGDQEDAFTSIVGLSIPLRVGIQPRIGHKTYLDLSAGYSFDSATLRGEPSLDDTTFRVGLMYRFLGRREVRYDYIRLNR